MNWGATTKKTEEKSKAERNPAPKDMFFEFGLERKGLDSPRLPLPKSY